MQYGKRINGRLEPKFIEKADMTKAGGVYQVDIETDGFVDENGIITQLLKLEQQTLDCKILFVNANAGNNVITMQFMDTGPGQFSLTGFLGAMPALLGVVFIAIIGYTLWQVYVTNPVLLWALLLLGAGIAFFYFTSGKISAPKEPIIKTGGEPKASATARYQQEQTNIRAQIKTVEKDIDRVDDEIKEKKKATSDASSKISIQAQRTGEYKTDKDKKYGEKARQLIDESKSLEKKKEELEEKRKDLYKQLR